MPLNAGDKPIRNPVVILREEFDDWAVLFNPDTGHGVGLNPTGVYLWKLLDGEHTIDDIVMGLRRHAEGVPEDDRDAIRTFIDNLIAAGLVGLDGLHAADQGQLCLGKYSGALHNEAGFAEKFAYEHPLIVDFREGRLAHGDCTPGSADSYNCSKGALAGNYCNQGTGAPCSPGTCISCGTNAYDGHYCQDGTDTRCGRVCTSFTQTCNTGYFTGSCQVGTLL